MSSKAIYWQIRIQKITSTFTDEFSPLSEKDLNWKPSKLHWSIAQVMEHIITTNQSYFPLFDQINKDKFKTPLIGKIPGIAAFMGKMILSYVQPDVKKKSKTVGLWEPSIGDIPIKIFERFKSHQEEFIVWIRTLEKHLDKNRIIHSPVNKNIVYTLDAAIEIMVTHEERHLNQAREVLRIKDQ